jgi:hypothetical protein
MFNEELLQNALFPEFDWGGRDEDSGIDTGKSGIQSDNSGDIRMGIFVGKVVSNCVFDSTS